MPQVQGGDLNLIMSSKIPKEQRKILKNDLGQLQNMNFASAADEETLNLMGLDDFNSHSVMAWLNERVSAVIEDTDTDKLKLSSKAFKDYPQNGEPNIEQALQAPRGGGSRGGGVTVMSNVGTGLYYAGKSSNQLITIKVKTGFLSSKKLTINSPRTGVIQIGEGLFMRKYLMNKENEGALANSLGRMAVFFHEARHSDGNGKSLGFFHAVCPNGHDFAGAYACDRNLNGPYSIGANMMKEFIKNCESCSVSEKEQMRLRYIDSMNRVLTETPKIKEDIDADVDLLKVQLDAQKMLYQVETMTGKPTVATYQKILELEKQLLSKAKEADAIEFVPSIKWDDSAETVNL